MMAPFNKLPEKVRARKEFLDQIGILGKEEVIRYGVSRAVMKYCGACGDEGNGCPDCRVYDFMQKSGVNTL
jgi:hypothetical protein